MNKRLLLVNGIIKNAFGSYKLRVLRFIVHLIPSLKSKYKLPYNNLFLWLGDLPIYILDLIFIPEVYEIALTLIRPSYRTINDEEKALGIEYFNQSINLEFVRINSAMSKSIQKYAHAFVTFNTINYNEKLSKPIFVHELVHIWQYQKYGSVYISRALLAQSSREGYDYGGVEGLYTGMLNEKKFLEFNFEQQGEIFEDYCRLKQASAGFQNSIVDATYQYYIDQVLTG